MIRYTATSTFTMTELVEPSSFAAPSAAAFPQVPVVPIEPPRRDAAEISLLLDSLDEAAAESGQSLARKRANDHENKLVQARLGIASGLHAALRSKHPPTASHCLRVALG